MKIKLGDTILTHIDLYEYPNDRNMGGLIGRVVRIDSPLKFNYKIRICGYKATRDYIDKYIMFREDELIKIE